MFILLVWNPLPKKYSFSFLFDWKIVTIHFPDLQSDQNGILFAHVEITKREKLVGVEAICWEQRHTWKLNP
jgi:hypothetical protein